MTIPVKNVLHTQEKKVKCPICEKINCLEEQIDDITTWLCIDCGYNSNTTYKNHSTELKKVLMTSPQIVIELKKYDEKKGVWWFPTILNMPLKGIVYPDGSADNWSWIYSPIVDIPENDKHLYPVPEKKGEFYEKRLAVEQSKTYNKDNFFSALKDLGAIVEHETDEEIEKKVEGFAEKAIEGEKEK